MSDLEQKDLIDNSEKLILLEGSCDGSTYPNNPGAGGIGLVFRVKKNGKTYIKTVSKSIPRWVRLNGELLKMANRNKTKKPVEKNGKFYMENTNNRSEIMAVIEAFIRVKEPEKTHIVLYCDSQWAINMTKGTWNPKDNIELVYIAKKLAEKFGKLEFKWVRGHSGDRFNEICDKLAYDAAKNQYKEPVVKIIKES